MQESDEGKFAAMLAALGGCFDKEIGDAMIAGYWMALKDLSIEDVARAFERAVQELEFFPKPVAIRRLCGSMSGEARAIVAWAAVRTAIGNHGSYASIDFDDPIVNATVRNMGGWVQLCAKPAEEFDVWTRKEFERVYCALLSSPVSTEAIAYLGGVHERSNEGKFKVEAPRAVAVGLPPHRAGLLPSTGDRRRIEAPKGGDGQKIAALVGDVLRGAE